MIPRTTHQQAECMRRQIRTGPAWQKLCVAVAVVGLFTAVAAGRVHAGTENQGGEPGELGIQISNSSVEFPYVLHLFNPSGAATAGVRILDVIHTVDGTTTKNMDIEDVVKRLRGPIGSTVVLTVKHPNDTDERTISIVRMSAEDRGEDDFFRGNTAYGAEEYKTAKKSLKRAAKQGHPVAQDLLGHMYQQGLGGRTSERQATKWLHRSAEQGYVWAQYQVGRMYRDGTGVDSDNATAVQWFRLAAEQGLIEAQADLGWMYDTGRGVARDYVKAVEWFRSAAERGHAMSQHNLGLAYQQATGVTKDMRAAIRWFRRAADQDFAHAKKALDDIPDEVNRVDAEILAEEAEAAGQPREALQHYVVSLRTGSLRTDVLKKSIRIAQELDPPPAVPEEARKYSVFAEVARDEARHDRGGLTQVVEEYVNAIRVAPWWPIPYLNIAFIEEERGRLDSARTYLELYQVAAAAVPPIANAPTAEEIQHKLYELEYKSKKK